jgi:hypothetical protein
MRARSDASRQCFTTFSECHVAPGNLHVTVDRHRSITSLLREKEREADLGITARSMRASRKIADVEMMEWGAGFWKEAE